MIIDLSGQLALVTGATGELGRAISRTLASCGADVAVHFHSNADYAHSLCAEIKGLGRSAAAFQADVTRCEPVQQMRDAVFAQLGKPSILVLNAVSQYEWKSILQQPLEDYEDQFRSCVAQAVLMTQSFVPAMVEAGKGSVIGINTECAVQCQPNQSAYAAGKRGLDGVLRVLSHEVGPDGITVNQVAPGWTVSEKDRRAGTEHQSGYESKVPLRRRGEDSDIANAVAFLASPQARFITGAFLPVCGGNVTVGI